MKKIIISDTTLCCEDNSYSFKEKIEIARQLDRLNVDVIELPEVRTPRADVLLVRTLSSFVKRSVLSVAAGADAESIEQAAAALSAAKHPRIRIELSLSPVGMEYLYHKKNPKMLKWIGEAVSLAKEHCSDVEFCAVDATRAEPDFLEKAIETAIGAGANALSVCDNAGLLMPDDFADFAERIAETVEVPVGVYFDNRYGLASAAAALSVKKAKITSVKTAVGPRCVPLDGFVDVVQNCGTDYAVETGIKYTEIHRTVKQILWITQHAGTQSGKAADRKSGESPLCLDGQDSKEDVIAAVSKLGYDLSEEDAANVYDAFLHVASRKNVGERELEAIVASTALQVPPTYVLVSYVINNGNIISSSAQIKLTRDGTVMEGVCIGDGPVNAAFLAIEQILGQHYELDDFQIQSVTEGTEAMGSAVVKLRFNGKLYSGNGISTDIIGASIRAYINAVNKIVYEEAAQ